MRSAGDARWADQGQQTDPPLYAVPVDVRQAPVFLGEHFDYPSLIMFQPRPYRILHPSPSPRALVALTIAAILVGAPACSSDDATDPAAPGQDAAPDNDPPGDAEPNDGGQDGQPDDGAEPGDTGTDADASGACPQGPDEPDIVNTELGPVRGQLSSDVLRFLGIPFALPPVGARRWQPPEATGCFDGVYEASEWAPPCIQFNKEEAKVIGSEDCLYLNVWAPTSASSVQRPVLVFIHGGGNVFGSASEQNSGIYLYDGEDLARRGDVIVITLQYRLNIMGYAVDSALDEESASGTSGNYGLRDQLAGLDWVQRNVAAFGGDPGRVLLFGESGGASDVCALVASPLATGLFTAAIIQSGGCGGLRRADVQGWTDAAFEAAGCPNGADRLECVRGLEGTTLVETITEETTGGGVVRAVAGPTIGDDVVPKSPLVAFLAGEHNDVPIVIGSNADETATPLFGIPMLMTAQQYETNVQTTFGADADAVLAAYPLTDYDTPRDAWVAITTDLQFTCPARVYARALANNQTAPVYRYFYTHVMDGTAASTRLGAGHGIELFFVFQTLDRLSTYPTDASDLAVESTMGGYWTAMAEGDPNANSSGLPVWPNYDAALDTYLELADPTVPGQGVRTAKCDFWESL